MTLVPERLRGETAIFDIKVARTVIVEAGRRITQRHIRELEKAGVKSLDVPFEFLHGKTLAHDIVDTKTGEVLANANDEITEELLATLLDSGVKKVDTIFTNDLDHGSFVSSTLKIDTTTNELEAQV